MAAEFIDEPEDVSRGAIGDEIEEIGQLLLEIRPNRPNMTVAVMNLFKFMTGMHHETIVRLCRSEQFVNTFREWVLHVRTVDIAPERDKFELAWQVRHVSPILLQLMQFARCSFYTGDADDRAWCDKQLDAGMILCMHHEHWIINAHRAAEAHLGHWLARICVNYVMPDYDRITFSGGFVASDL